MRIGSDMILRDFMIFQKLSRLFILIILISVGGKHQKKNKEKLVNKKSSTSETFNQNNGVY